MLTGIPERKRVEAFGIGMGTDSQCAVGGTRVVDGAHMDGGSRSNTNVVYAQLGVAENMLAERVGALGSLYVHFIC
jgi:hypothetical protein